MQDFIDIIKIVQGQLKASGQSGFLKLLDPEPSTTNYNLIMFLDKKGLIKMTEDLKLALFKALFNSGYFCYVPGTSQDFKDHYEYIYHDLVIIGQIVDSPSLEVLDLELKTILQEFYLFDRPIGLKDILL